MGRGKKVQLIKLNFECRYSKNLKLKLAGYPTYLPKVSESLNRQTSMTYKVPQLPK